MLLITAQFRRDRRAFSRDEGGAVAVEFAMLASVFIVLMLGCLQYALFFVASLQMRSVLAETTARAASFANTTFAPETKDWGKVSESICKDLILTVNCTSNLKLEQIPLASMSSSYQAISNAKTLDPGSSGTVLVRRAEIPIVTFVPGIQPLLIRSSSVWLRR